MHSTATLPDTGFLRLPEVLRLYPVSRSTWWAGVRAGRYPQPVKLGLRATAWRVEDIRDMILAASQAAGQA
ncbi:helix-turn-helix transcriptional regulator [Xanthomonas campestris]|uniref:helix-turn-helix transcriptional regulator n=1 Tax=Xanthomonas campestris TaxID=339 RepID=UPI002B224221|nr:AlpA family phage regulatory protein [Xanthomonas campestris]MEA9657997.1 AlpA family phage regulatory protein [Xanthomonas campestris pv. raphani]MEA9884739.1 AlpA family phage regulatory protein [Xanthomonas campestris pv. raphani]MEB2180607.1 AlpA family phage regulatory protein [Xanthomonas campestris pv. campestris]